MSETATNATAAALPPLALGEGRGEGLSSSAGSVSQEDQPLTPTVSQGERGQDSLWTILKEDYAAHDRDWTRPGFRAVAAHRFGNWRMGIRSKLVRAPFTVLYNMIYRRARNVYGIELPYTVKLGRRVIFEHQSGIVIHGHSTIGDGCIIRQGVTLGNKSLDRPLDAPTLGRDVNVGAGAKILGAVTIGDGATIGANAVVVRDVPAGAVAVGIPAQIMLPAKKQ